MTVPTLAPAMTLRVEIGEVLRIGRVAEGHRQIITITGGTFRGTTPSGEAFEGEVVPGGADWNTSLTDGGSDLWARYALRTDRGEVVDVVNAGLSHPTNDGTGDDAAAAERILTAPRFAVDLDGRLAFLARSLFLATVELAPGGGAVDVEVYRVQ